MKDIYFTKSNVTLFSTEALEEDVTKNNWWRHRIDGTNKPNVEHGFRVPPGIKVDLSKVTPKQRERFLTDPKHSGISFAKEARKDPEKTMTAIKGARKVQPSDKGDS